MQAQFDAIILPVSPDEEAFLQNCAVYCELDCCGFNAVDLSELQVQACVATIGLESAKRALVAVWSQCHRIGDHVGQVRFRGFFEPAHETRRKYEEACAVLERVIKEVEQGGGGTALEPPSHPSTAPPKARATP